VSAAAGIQKLSGGMVRCMGADVAHTRGRKLAELRAFVPQRPKVPEGITVREALEIGRSARIGPLRRATKDDRAAIEGSLERAGVSHLSGRRLTTLSGGELQRVQIAIGLVQDTPVLIADEPTSQLDLGATVSVARLLRGLADDGLSVLLVVHDLALAAAVADTVVVMSNGTSVATGRPDEVLSEERLAEVWGVSARLDHTEDATALSVRWLDALEGRGGDRP
jgi:iron complex transport system ATP-binding protein